MPNERACACMCLVPCQDCTACFADLTSTSRAMRPLRSAGSVWDHHEDHDPAGLRLGPRYGTVVREMHRPELPYRTDPAAQHRESLRRRCLGARHPRGLSAGVISNALLAWDAALAVTLPGHAALHASLEVPTMGRKMPLALSSGRAVP
jgi:hypothetical protein